MLVSCDKDKDNKSNGERPNYADSFNGNWYLPPSFKEEFSYTTAISIQNAKLESGELQLMRPQGDNCVSWTPYTISDNRLTVEDASCSLDIEIQTGIFKEESQGDDARRDGHLASLGLKSNVMYKVDTERFHRIVNSIPSESLDNVPESMKTAYFAGIPADQAEQAKDSWLEFSTTKSFITTDTFNSEIIFDGTFKHKWISDDVFCTIVSKNSNTAGYSLILPISGERTYFWTPYRNADGLFVTGTVHNRVDSSLNYDNMINFHINEDAIMCRKNIISGPILPEDLTSTDFFTSKSL